MVLLPFESTFPLIRRSKILKDFRNRVNDDDQYFSSSARPRRCGRYRPRRSIRRAASRLVPWSGRSTRTCRSARARIRSRGPAPFPSACATNSPRISLMRTRMPASSSSHSWRSSGVASTVATTLPPCSRRVRVVGAHHALELRQHARRLVGAGGDHAQRADALAVQRERLRERVRHQQRAAGRGEAAHHFTVFADAGARSPGRPCRGTESGRRR